MVLHMQEYTKMQILYSNTLKNIYFHNYISIYNTFDIPISDKF